MAVDETKSFNVSPVRLFSAMFLAMVVDGVDLQMLALALPSIMKELNISNMIGGSLATATMLGMLLGGIYGGWLADRIGRVKVVAIAIVGFTISTAMMAACADYWALVIMRFIGGCFMSAAFTPSQTMTAEFTPTKWRATAVGTMQAGWSLGYVVAGIMSSYILPYGWRALFLASIVPGVISLMLMYGLKDAPSYIASRQAIRAAGKNKNEYAQIFADKMVRTTFYLWCATAIFLQFGYYGVNTWLPTYLVRELGVNLKSMGWFIAGTYSAMVLGKSAAGFLGDKLGRKVVWLASGLGTAIVLPAIVYFATADNIAYLLLAAGLLFGAPWGVNGAFMTESFPTAVRATAMGTAHNLGKFGAMAAPMLVGAVSTQYSIAYGIGLMGAAYAICGLIPPLFIREHLYDPKAVVEQNKDIAGSAVGVALATTEIIRKDL